MEPASTEEGSSRREGSGASRSVIVAVVLVLVGLAGATGVWAYQSFLGGEAEEVAASDTTASAPSTAPPTTAPGAVSSSSTPRETTTSADEVTSTKGSPAPSAAADLSDLVITVGSKDFDEQIILGEMLVALLEEAGAEVVDRLSMGGTAVVRPALEDGDIDAYVEYNGTGWYVGLGRTSRISDPEELTAAVARGDLAENGIRWLGRSPFSNSYGFASGPAVTAQRGDPFDFHSMAEHLASHPDARLCVEPEFPNRDDGLILFETATDYSVPSEQLSILETGEIYRATAESRCTFGEVFSTDSRILGWGLTLVQDPGIMGLYNASVVMSDELYQQAPQVFETLAESMLTPLTQSHMTELNWRVSDRSESPSFVARSHLMEEGLLAP